MARIYGLESENVAKKCAVRFGVFTVDNYVSARNHLLLQLNIGNSATWTRDWPLHGHHVLHPIFDIPGFALDICFVNHLSSFPKLSWLKLGRDRDGA